MTSSFASYASHFMEQRASTPLFYSIISERDDEEELRERDEEEELRDELTESLMHEGRINRRKEIPDLPWLYAFTVCFTLCLVLCLYVTFTTSSLPPLIHTLPLLTTLTIVASLVAYLHLFLLSLFIKPVLIMTTVFVPMTLVLSFIWSFVGSFFSGGWSLRLFSLIPLLLGLASGRNLGDLPNDIHRASTTLSLIVRILTGTPLILLLSPSLLLLSFVASIPFITLIFQWRFPYFALGVWLWTWAVMRGVLSVWVSRAIKLWYKDHPVSMDLPKETFGSIALGALVLSVTRIARLFPVTRALPSVERYSQSGLVVVGITGKGFFEASTNGGAANRRNSATFKSSLSILTTTPLTLCLPFSLLTFFLSSRANRVEAALLAAGVTALVGVFAVGVVRDVEEALWVLNEQESQEGAGDQGDADRRAQVALCVRLSPFLSLIFLTIHSLIHLSLRKAFSLQTRDNLNYLLIVTLAARTVNLLERTNFVAETPVYEKSPCLSHKTGNLTRLRILRHLKCLPRVKFHLVWIPMTHGWIRMTREILLMLLIISQESRVIQRIPGNREPQWKRHKI
ncbi:hypothetical protein C8J56DRAFT_135644 [Mycena floridula]|nr:hypothetical protein C8J56DRAFT_135644 [Mycena floridula]